MKSESNTPSRPPMEANNAISDPVALGRKRYREELAGKPSILSGMAVRSRWAPDAEVGTERLREAVEQAEASQEFRVIKQTDRIRVARARLLGRDALIKRYNLHNTRTKLKYLFRPSRARRAWAAGVVMTELGLPTPKPLGFLEVFHHGIPVRSYVITEFIADARAARKWIKPWYHSRSPKLRESFRKQLLELLLDLYRKGVYHADTKSSNMLLHDPEDDSKRSFHWIDLECVRFGIRPSRRLIVRNLVQLNGSLGSKVSEDDRMAFLHDMSRFYPWATDASIVRRIRKWTRRRLMRELRLWCGS